jgi:hypothetical protein
MPQAWGTSSSTLGAVRERELRRMCGRRRADDSRGADARTVHGVSDIRVLQCWDRTVRATSGGVPHLKGFLSVRCIGGG